MADVPSKRDTRVALSFVLLAIVLALAPATPTGATFNAFSDSPGSAVSTLTVAPPADQASPGTGSDGAVSLSWGASPTAASASVTYYVTRRPSGAGSYTEIAGPLSSLAYTDDPNADGAYDYVIRASVSGFTADSVVRTGTSDGTPPGQATNLTAQSGAVGGAATVELSWTAATDATTGVAGYTIRRAQVSTALSPCPAATAANYPNSTEVGAVTSATVTVTSSLTFHCFHLIARDVAGNAGAASATVGPATAQ